MSADPATVEILGQTYIRPDDTWFMAPYPPGDTMHALLSEGFCPLAHGRLVRDRVPDHGWCPVCRVGWSLAGGVMHAQLSAARGEQG